MSWVASQTGVCLSQFRGSWTFIKAAGIWEKFSEDVCPISISWEFSFLPTYETFLSSLSSFPSSLICCRLWKYQRSQMRLLKPPRVLRAARGGRLDHDAGNNVQAGPEEQHSHIPWCPAAPLQKQHMALDREHFGLGSVCNTQHPTVSQTQVVRAWLGTSAKKDREPCCSPRPAHKLSEKKKIDLRLVCSDRRATGRERTTPGNHFQCAGNKKEQIFQILFKRR